jgi:FKBP-type peptidyl-prolyl cis-trans isomerase FkpA
VRHHRLAILAALAIACGDAREPASERSASGLEYTELSPGSGAQPGPDAVVEVHYQGSFPDGRVFDSSRERGMPARFPLSGVIPCWTEGVARMRVGGKARLVCPPQIAYGERGAPPRIPPHATLVFEIELLRVVQ